MSRDNISKLTDSFIAVMLQDLEYRINEENFIEGRNAPEVYLDQSDLDPNTLQYIARFCRDFYIANEEHIHAPDACKRYATHSVVSYAGSDLYMALAGHGVGFLDSTCWGATPGGAMYRYAKDMGHFDGAYIGEDGKVYL